MPAAVAIKREDYTATKLRQVAARPALRLGLHLRRGLPGETPFHRQ